MRESLERLGLGIAAGLLVLCGFIWGVWTNGEIASYLRWHEINHRGYVRCVDGHFEVGNFDLTGRFVHPVIDLTEPVCEPPTPQEETR